RTSRGVGVAPQHPRRHVFFAYVRARRGRNDAMYPLGHVGIGMRIVPARVRAVISAGWLAFGCLLPDLIDKPVFVAARLARRTLPESFDVWLDVLHGSRLLGHSLFFFAAVV